ncbi:MAG TPA: hypothetical protein VF180_15215 [Acidimicrobiia bacterium]
MPMLSETNNPSSWGEVVDTPKKPQRSDEEEVPAPPAPAPSPALPARSPFRPVSRRRRQAQLPDPPAVVERPETNMIFDASPTTIAAALAKAGAPSAESSLAWRPGDDSHVEVDVDFDVEIELGENGEAGTASPR